jgi:hypothetical protein
MIDKERGEITSIYDSRTGGSSIFIKYKNTQDKKQPEEKKSSPENKNVKNRKKR